MIRSCARRSFAAATIFIALVICCVFFTDRMRRRRSMSDGICIGQLRSSPSSKRILAQRILRALRSLLGSGRLSAGELAGKLLHRRVERRLELIVEHLLLGDPTEDV